ncbi:hypothetical protein K440DRAFT_633690 [Wilcoxina mikolae CBS 423.85]|nr:hypothetical protein K440DRAFT_633690 [Wilcoxina mikolae CBS 423.85]
MPPPPHPPPPPPQQHPWYMTPPTTPLPAANKQKKLQFRLPPSPSPPPPVQQTQPHRVPDAKLRKIIITPEMDATNISPLHRLENALKRKTVELEIAEGIARGRRREGGEEGAEEEAMVVRKVMAGRVEY